MQVMQFEWVEYLVHQIQRRVFVPRRGDVLIDLQRPIAVLDQREMVVAVVDELVVHRRRPDRHAVAEHHRPRRVEVIR